MTQGGDSSVAAETNTLLGMEADDNVSDEGYAESTSSSYVSSIASEIRRGVVERGRLYATHGQHKAWVPADESEMDRNDLNHCKFLLLMENQLHLAPIHPNPQKILDLGTGTGIWTIDMADKYASALIIGVDTASIQPSWVPPNVQFEIDDIEDDWLWAKESFDFIHGRELILAIRDWPKLIKQSFQALKPGGYLELAGSVPLFASDDGTLPAEGAYLELAQVFFDMGEKIGASGKDPLRWRGLLEAMGFVDVKETILKIPTNPWPKDKRLKQIGALELAHYFYGIDNLFARAYTQVLGGDPAYLQILLAKCRKQVQDRSMHSYLPFYVVYGKKPGKLSSES